MKTVIVMAHLKPFTTACPARQGRLTVSGQQRTQPCVAPQQPVQTAAELPQGGCRIRRGGRLLRRRAGSLAGRGSSLEIWPGGGPNDAMIEEIDAGHAPCNEAHTDEPVTPACSADRSRITAPCDPRLEIWGDRNAAASTGNAGCVTRVGLLGPGHWARAALGCDGRSNGRSADAPQREKRGRGGQEETESRPAG